MVRKNSYRSIWISDLHLGTRGCKAKYVLDFLKKNECENLYLVGDIVDGWRLKSNFYWPQSHSDVIRKILALSNQGTNVFYITGNHDEFLRKFTDYGLEMGNVKIVNKYIHTTVDGRKYLVTHGDKYDIITMYHRWIAFLGSKAYSILYGLNVLYNSIRNTFGLGHWSLSAYLKRRVKKAMEIIFEFEKGVVHECIQENLDGVVCGHIHHADSKYISGIHYCNSGDWVESCTAITEDFEGNLEVLYWNNSRKSLSENSKY